ncbi:MAG: 30S ribosomal protein S16 [Lentisphaerae bacterium]|nr:30S ribosomal protein S16 [Lentisphaerota bacterium]
MAVKIRMTRTGTTNNPAFRIIVVDSRAPRDGACIEFLGWYNPRVEGENHSLNLERVDYWLKKGAEPTNTVRSLIRKTRRKAEAVASQPETTAPVA